MVVAAGGKGGAVNALEKLLSSCLADPSGSNGWGEAAQGALGRQTRSGGMGIQGLGACTGWVWITGWRHLGFHPEESIAAGKLYRINHDFTLHQVHFHVASTVLSCFQQLQSIFPPRVMLTERAWCSEKEQGSWKVSL